METNREPDPVDAIPVGGATELPSGFGHLLFDLALDEIAAKDKARGDDPEAWELEPR